MGRSAPPVHERPRRASSGTTDPAGAAYQRALESPRGIGHHHQQRQPLSAAGFLEVIHQERVSDPTEDPVRVMTVHQSKGLQFDVVLLPDLNRRLIGQTPNCVFDRPRATDPIGRIVRYVPEGLRTLLPAWIQTVHENHELLSVREELSVLYVALTRAVHSLQMIVAPSEYAASGDAEDKPRRKQNPERLEATLAGLIRAALADGVTVPPETLVAQFGDPDWWTHLPPAREPLGTTPAIPARPSIRFAARSDRGRARGEPAVNPSQLEGGGRVRIRQRVELPNQAAMFHGTLIHAFYELIDWLEGGVPEINQLRATGASSTPIRSISNGRSVSSANNFSGRKSGGF